jgi:hypothetical protein
MKITSLDDFAAWWATVSPEFAFLLALPFAVAAVAFAANCIRCHWRGQKEER